MNSIPRFAKIQLTSWRLLEANHIDPFPVFSQVGLNPQLMYDPNGSYPYSKILKLWDLMAELIPDQSFGIHAGKYWHPSFLGTLGYTLLASPSLRSTLETFIEYQSFLSNEKATCRLEENDENDSIVFYFPKEQNRPGRFPREDSTAASFYHILQMNYSRGDLSPIKIHFTHETPLHIAPYFSVFKCPIQFEQKSSCIEITRKDADTVVPIAPDSLRDFSKKEMQTLGAQKKRLTYAYRTKMLIKKNIQDSSCTIEKISQKLGLSVKSLQRSLKAENTTYKEIYDAVRVALAKEYLRRKNLDITDISFRLGFSETSAFSRSFKALVGQTPSAFREEAEKN